MSYCLNPACTQPENSEAAECQCGAKLQLGNRYRALKPIGQGGFGRTFLAVDERHEQKSLCVIKQFFTAIAANRQQASDLFRQEALRLKELGHHPQIPYLLDYLEQDGQQYLIQEFIDGRSLEQELSDRGAFSELEIRQLLLDLLPVLQFIHDRQVIHRDIKPANIIRRASDQKLVLVDLGAAKHAIGTALLKTGTAIGSAEYTAPEQARGKAVFASDLYSLGATCIHLLTELSPFDLFDSSDDRWAWRDYLNQPVNHSLAQVLDRMLQNATNRRYRSADEVFADLNQPTRKPQLTEPAIEPETQRPIEVAQAEAATVHPDLSFEQGGTVAVGDARKEARLAKPTKLQRLVTSRIWLLYIFFMTVFLGSAWFPSLPANLKNLFAKQLQPITQIRDGSAHTLFSLGTVNTLAVSADDRTLASVSYDLGSVPGELVHHIEIWNYQTGQQIGTALPAQQGESVAVSSDGKILVTYGATVDAQQLRAVKIWNLESGQLIRQIKVGEGATSAVISPDGQTLITAVDRSIELWNLRTGERIRALPSTPNAVNAIAISSDGRTLFDLENSGSSNRMTRVWDLQTGTIRRTWQNSSTQPIVVTNVAVTADRLAVIVGYRQIESTTSLVEVWKLDTGEQIHTLDLGSQADFSAISRNGILATYSITAGNGVELWDIRSGKRIRTLPAPSGTSTASLVFSPDGRSLIVGGRDGVIKVWAID